MFDLRMVFLLLVLALSVAVLVRGEILVRRDRAARFARYAELSRPKRELAPADSENGLPAFGRPFSEDYESRGLGPCRCAELAVPSHGSALSAGTDEESRNDDHFTQQGTVSADSTKGNQS